MKTIIFAIAFILMSVPAYGDGNDRQSETDKMCALMKTTGHEVLRHIQDDYVARGMPDVSDFVMAVYEACRHPNDYTIERGLRLAKGLNVRFILRDIERQREFYSELEDEEFTDEDQ